MKKILLLFILLFFSNVLCAQYTHTFKEHSSVSSPSSTSPLFVYLYSDLFNWVGNKKPRSIKKTRFIDIDDNVLITGVNCSVNTCAPNVVRGADLNTDNIQIDGQLTISQYGQIRNFNKTRLNNGGHLINNGIIDCNRSLNVLGELFNNSTGRLSIRSSSTLNFYPSATIKQFTGELLLDGTWNIYSGVNIPNNLSSFTGTGTIKNAGVFLNDFTIKRNMKLEMGVDAIGTATFNKNLSFQNNTKSYFHIISADNFDKLVVGNTINLNNNQLYVSLNYKPNVGEKFKIITHNGSTGKFGTLNLPTTNTWNVAYNAKDITLEVTGCTGTDNKAPTLSTIPNQVGYFNASNNFVVPDYTHLFTVADNCDVSPVLTQSPVAGTVINTLTDTVITVTATDASSNSQQSTFTVTTKNGTVQTQTLSGASAINCPQDNTVTLQNSETDYKYILRNNTTKKFIGNTQEGTNSALNFQTGVVSKSMNYQVFAGIPKSYALNFDGTDDYVEIPNDNSFTFSDGITIDTWVKPSNQILNQNWSDIYRKENDADGSVQGRIMLIFDNSDASNSNVKLRFGIETTNNGFIEVTNQLVPANIIDKWTHIMAFYNNATNSLKLYVNGAEVASTIANGTIVNPSATKATNATIGAYRHRTSGLVEYFKGDIATLRIYNRAPSTTSEISDFLHKGKNNLFLGDETGLVAYYPFFENTGTQLTDVTTNAYNGTINGASWTTGNVGGLLRAVSNVVTITKNEVITYVDKTATGTNDGSSWSNAFTSIQTAVNATCNTGKIYIAKGTYKEGSEISIGNSISLIGGFPVGGGTQNIDTNKTILDGNATYRVINATNSNAIILNGLVIQNGYVNAGNGGGVLGNNITLNNCLVKDNIILDTRNFLTAYGGGVYASGNLNVINSIIQENQVSTTGNFSKVYGAGIFGDSAINITNSVVQNNVLTATGNNVLCIGFGIYTFNGHISLTNSIVAFNKAKSTSATLFGGVYGNNTIQLNNSVLWGNEASSNSGSSYSPSEFYSETGTLVANNSLIKAQYPNDVNNINNINATIAGFNPLFVDEANGDFRLQTGSPLINAGNNTYNTTIEDLDGNTRIKNTNVDIGSYEYQNPFTGWTGHIDSSWDNTNNWNGGIPNNTTETYIYKTGNQPILITNGQTKTLTLATNANLNINAGKSLMVANDLTNNGTITINSNATSSGSLLVKGTSTGNITYNRYVANEWHLVASPVIGQNMNDFAVTNAATNQIIKNGDGTKYAIAPYNNNVPTNNWAYVLVADIASAGNFTNGKGYSMKRSTAGTFSFTGTLENNAKTINLVDGSKNNWNAIGNPYPSFIKLNNLVDATNNLLTVNKSVLNVDKVAVYLWDATTTSYKPYNESNTDIQYIAPAQGFFVDTKVGGGTFTITKNMLTHNLGNTFSKRAKTNNIFEIELKISDESQTKSTQIKYLKNATKGLDVGYDAGIFSAEESSFNVFSQLLENGANKSFALQCLPNSAYENMVIPIGIHADANKTIIFSLDAVNIPKGINIYLEDKQENTFTNLSDTNAVYKVTLFKTKNEVGRFYLHTTSQVLSTDDFSTALEQVKVWLSDKRTLQVANLPEGKSTLKMYNVLGKQVLVRFLDSARNNNEAQLSLQSHSRGLSFLLPKSLSEGIYLVKVKTNKGIKTKKIYLE
ncbi:choice-of-anchor Q domain-containing protein [Polaribacter cellanae]|uniref:T9SS type A sorting domain-containing protein n=1 Tax=Polaribacter cellanae TaxID=2818493 RepID=A0A975H775_9FLAO|nr:choice-of-anchor Q domain-containing protein [Polaribacter cellanae]QTE23221.1 T9SS type A sorting domain-containing protein [Polaribacter cellanae]